jgi:hypothetical protein
MHQILQLNRRVLHGALVMLERSAGNLARSVLRGERSREAPDLPDGVHPNFCSPKKEARMRACRFAIISTR